MASGAPQHSAAGQALGYLHQCMWALVELGRRAPDPATQLRLECLDDIQFDASGTPEELLQTKHHIGSSSGSLTPSSTDLWRTLNVWMDLQSCEDLLLRLVTTQKIPSNSPLRGLRSGADRDTAGALSALVKAAEESRSSTSAPWRQKFIKMGIDGQEELIGKIVIDDNSTQASDFDKDLTRTFRFAIPVGKEPVFTHLIKGWWAGISVQLLAGNLEAITGNDLVLQVNDIADQLKHDTLPVDPQVMQDYDESIVDTYKDRPFVQQLLWIAFENNRLWKAIRDYHRAYSQRSFWLRHQLLAEAELDRYAFKLHDEWEQIFDASMASMSHSGRTDAELVGQEILAELTKTCRARVRERFDEQWFNRGMLHALADGELGQRIGWHPEFEKKLEALLIHV
ncbi:hypothetical protein FOE78_03830 [Microlunatus elymi]|uniref:ABC-three component systems C-terminal domain-containing protein n=1 Tax=Microlunatus elymi TaxID=2596828 RepID=A0A516PVG8_9ACTN|nr:ABC-three component system protein [Microlunatus elymi]QDP95159.1 hypothetical protein FOE78_03830 [Microlunatus elymi]